MDRPLPRHRYLLAALLLLVALVPALGCTAVLTTVFYLVRGTDLPAEYNGLRDKRVAVVCQPMVELQYRNGTVAKDLARRVNRLLKDRVKKITLIDQRKVDEWVDENSWEDYADIGKALKADVVVGIDLEDFSLLMSQTLYQGKANVTLKVVDCSEAEGKVVFERTLPQVIFPPNHGVPMTDRQESQFRREYMDVLADRVARFFYPHDPYQDQALDATAL